MNNFRGLLDKYNAKSFQNIKINIEGEQITLLSREGDIIDFEGVRSFFYIEEEDMEFERLPNSSIEYNPAGFGEFVSLDDYEEEVYSVPNFSLSILNKNLLIEADSIKIAGSKFQLRTNSN